MQEVLYFVLLLEQTDQMMAFIKALNKNIYWSTVLKFNYEVLYSSISMFCDFYITFQFNILHANSNQFTKYDVFLLL